MQVVRQLVIGLCICLGPATYSADETGRAAHGAIADDGVLLFDARSALAPDQEATSLDADEAKHLALLRSIHRAPDSMSVLPSLNLRALDGNSVAVIVPGGVRLRFTGKRTPVPGQKDNYVWSGSGESSPALRNGGMAVAFSTTKEPSLVGDIRGGQKVYSIMGLGGGSRHYVLIDHVVRPSFHGAVREPPRAQ